jgi:hypothetical protein
MPKVRLTNTVVEKATCPPGKDRREWWDTVSTGLVLRVTDGAPELVRDLRSPVTNKQTKLRLGDVKETLASNGLTLAQARSENVKIQGDIDAGRDPRLERKRAQAEERRQLEAEWHERSRATFRVLVDDYLAQKQGLRPGTLKTYLSVLNREILPELGNKLVRELTALDLEVPIEGVVKRGRKARARTVKTALGSIWGWARRTAKWRELGLTRDIVLEINPDLTTKGEPRKRKLSDDEPGAYGMRSQEAILVFPPRSHSSSRSC